jgi:murein DD-endopeptidase MepM/ murein hydrolase activator NlpD
LGLEGGQLLANWIWGVLVINRQRPSPPGYALRVFAQVALCFVPGTLNPDLATSLEREWPPGSVPLKLQENIQLKPETGGAPWVSIDLVIPVIQGAAALMLGTVVIEAVKRVARQLKALFPAVNIRVISDRHPTAAYEVPSGDDLEHAIAAIPGDYRRQSRTEVTLKRWESGAWQIRFVRSKVVESPASKPPILMGHGAQPATASGARSTKRRKREAGIASEARQLEASIRGATRAQAIALSEIDEFMSKYAVLRSQASTRTERRVVEASHKRALAFRDAEAERVLARWGRDLWLHEGVDVGIPADTEICAARGGLVVEVGVDGYGPQSVKARCGDVDIILGHLSRAVVVVGQEVVKGELLGYSGSEGGVSGGPHLHFEVRPAGGEYGDTLDPMAFLQSDLADAAPSDTYGTDLEP